MAAPVLSIPSELFSPAESKLYSGEYDLPILKAGPDLYEFAAPLAWQVSVTNTGGALLVVGTVEGTAKTGCARCAEIFEFPVTGEIEGYFLLAEDDQIELEDVEEDEFEVLGPDNIIDLDPLLKAGIFVEVPLVPLCQDDCKGLCQTCGKNLNEGDCSCTSEAEADRATQNPFAVLKELHFDN